MDPVVRFKTFPPILVRLLARKKGRPLTNEQIGFASGLPRYVVDSYSVQENWHAIPVMDALAFMNGCGLGLNDMKAWRRVESYLRMNPTFRYLRISGEWENYFQPLLVKWRRTQGQVSTTSPIWPPVRALLIRLNPLLNK